MNSFYCGDYPGSEENPLAIPNDTCAQPGLDPLHNFMSYGDDPCIDRFSEGQNTRTVLGWEAFRGRAIAGLSSSPARPWRLTAGCVRSAASNARRVRVHEFGRDGASSVGDEQEPGTRRDML